MDIIEATRQLGKVIQQDARYKAYVNARNTSDNDEELQKLVGEFNLTRMSIDNELQKEDEKDPEKVKTLNVKLREIYQEVMKNSNMIAFNNAKNEIETVMQRVKGIIDMSLEGEDPETCEPASGCTGSCATCGGCH